MIAIQHTSYGFRIIHNDVVPDKEHSRAYDMVLRNERRLDGTLVKVTKRIECDAYKCMCCGAWWMESITSPVLYKDNEYLKDKEERDKSCQRTN